MSTEVRNPQYWADLLSDVPPTPVAEAPVDPDWRARMLSQGYVQAPHLLNDAALQPCREVVARVQAAGWLPIFSFLHDAPWLLVRQPPLAALAAALLGPQYRQLPDFWTYDVRPGEHGYRPHREVGKDEMVAADGTPLAVTMWTALTDATLDNGCMYVIPRDLEQQVLNPAEYGADPSALLPFLLHRVKALPVSAGSVLSWNHHTLHWGAFSSPYAAAPRLAISVEFIRGDVDPGLHPHSGTPATTLDPQVLPPFEARLRMIARNIRSYYGRGGDDRWQQLAGELLASS